MKYIIVAAFDNEYAILFDEVLTHKKVAGDRHVMSAGFCILGVAEGDDAGDAEVVPHTYGESVSLGKKSRPSDEAIVAKALRRRI